MGLRRAEICGLSLDDLKGNELWIHRDLVYRKGEWILKETPKTNASNRKIILPDKLVQEIQQQGYIYNGHPNALNKAIHRFQKKLDIPAFRFHDMRLYFCSYAHDLGISEANIMSIGGWSTPTVMRKVYRKAFEKSKKEAMELYIDKAFGK
jgi:integrase